MTSDKKVKLECLKISSKKSDNTTDFFLLAQNMVDYINTPGARFSQQEKQAEEVKPTEDATV